MKILVACEESQAVCSAFRAKGHEAYSCDIQEPSGGHPEWHILGDVLPLINGNLAEFQTMDGEWHDLYHGDDDWYPKWDMIIAFPPCTHLAVSGARHFEKKRADGRQREGIEFFSQFLKADCEKVCIENPVNIIGGEYMKKWFPEFGWMPKCTQKIQPWNFGDNFSKTTCLWLKGLPNLIPEVTEEPQLEYWEGTRKTGDRTGEKVRMPLWYYKAKHGKGYGKDRSKTFSGIARAMSEAWG